MKQFIQLLLIALLIATSAQKALKQKSDIPDDILKEFKQSYANNKGKIGSQSLLYSEYGNQAVSKTIYNLNVFGSVQETEIIQYFDIPNYNYNNRDINYDFAFAISPKAAFISLEAEFEDFILQGIIKEKTQAQKEYMEAVKEGKKAAYSSIIDKHPHLMSLRLGNVPRGSQLVIKYKYIEKLGVAMNKFWKINIPLKISISGENESPEAELANQIKYSQEQKKIFVKIHQNPKDITFLDSPTHKEHIVTKKFPNYMHIMLDPTQSTNRNQQQYFELLFRDSMINKPSYKLTHLPEDPNWPYVAEITFVPDLNFENAENSFRKYMKGSTIQQFKNIDKFQGEYIFIVDIDDEYNPKMQQDALWEAISLLPEKTKFNIIYQDFKSDKMVYMFKESQYPSFWNKLKLYFKLSDIKGTQQENKYQVYDILKEHFEFYPIEQGYAKSFILITDRSYEKPDKFIQLINYHCADKNQRLYILGMDGSVDISFLMMAAQAGRGLYEITNTDESQFKQKLNYIIQDTISEFLDKFYFYLDNEVVDMTVPSIKRVKSLRKNEPFSMFVFLNDKWDKETLDFSLEYRESYDHKIHTKKITIEKSKALINEKGLHVLGVKKMLDSLLFNTLYAPKRGAFTDIYTRTPQNSAYNYSVELSTHYQVLSQFTSFILTEKEEYQQQEQEEIELDNEQQIKKFIDQLPNDEQYDDNEDLKQQQDQHVQKLSTYERNQKLNQQQLNQYKNKKKSTAETETLAEEDSSNDQQENVQGEVRQRQPEPMMDQGGNANILTFNLVLILVLLLLQL